MILFEYSEKHVAATVGNWVLVPGSPRDNSEKFNGNFGVIILDAGTAKIQTTNASIEIMEKVIAGTATVEELKYVHPDDWAVGAVTASTNEQLPTTITAFRCVSVGASVETIFNVKVEK